MTRSERMATGVIATVGLVIVTGCGGPFAVLPGGALRGDVESPPSDWSFARSIETAQLETRPDAPHSVNVWFVSLGRVDLGRERRSRPERPHPTRRDDLPARCVAGRVTRGLRGGRSRLRVEVRDPTKLERGRGLPLRARAARRAPGQRGDPLPDRGRASVGPRRRREARARCTDARKCNLNVVLINH